MESNNESGEPTRKRLRTSHACDVCRARKIRCNGDQPCATCAASGVDCTYGSEANSRGKSDLILEGVLRVERSLKELTASMSSESRMIASSITYPGSTSVSPHQEGEFFAPNNPLVQTPSSEVRRGEASIFDNAVLDSMHTSTTEAILQWPHFEEFPSLRSNSTSIFRQEQSRTPLGIRPNRDYPELSSDELDAVIKSFSHCVNFWYPTMSQRQLQRICTMVECGTYDEDSLGSCLALVAVALGCASMVTSGLRKESFISDRERQRRLRMRRMGMAYFEGALAKAHLAHLHLNSEATQCLFFIALYFAFLVRPLQAWEYLNATAAKCLLLLAYPHRDDSVEDQERIRRIFWSCYILESDYMAELSACPPSGIARVESSVPLPGAYHTHLEDAEEEQSSLYFLACISMRRLLNRVHQLLYARDSGAARDGASFHGVVAELKHQLDEWRDVLPAAFAFRLDTASTATEAGGFLRQRYLTCQAVIYRPYLMWVLNGNPVDHSPSDLHTLSGDILGNCKACLDACIMHVLNLRSFGHTVLIDTWICSLSMAGAMLIVLSACRLPVLRDLIEPDVLRLGQHLKQLFTSWQRLLIGSDSPSVEYSLWIIHEADSYIKKLYRIG